MEVGRAAHEPMGHVVVEIDTAVVRRAERFASYLRSLTICRCIKRMTEESLNKTLRSVAFQTLNIFE